jgi:molybdate transport system ATP-binding protein
MVYVSHDPDETRRLAGHVVMLKHGRIAAQGGPEILPA